MTEVEVIPISRWGKDHWSTLAYIETRIVDHGGNINNNHMRCNNRLHRNLAHAVDGAGYPTKLNDGTTVEPHDDWSCAEDMVAEGLIKIEEKMVSKAAFGGMRVKAKLTPKGLEVAAALRTHKAAGGNFAQFRWAGEHINAQE